jgi:hypothetical protein
MLSFRYYFARRFKDDKVVLNQVLELGFNFFFLHGIFLLAEFGHLLVALEVGHVSVSCCVCYV